MNEADVNTIFQSQDVQALCALDSIDLENCLVELVYQFYYKRPLESLNTAQRMMFLCITLEDHVQADGLLSLTEDETLFFCLPETRLDLLALGAPQTAAAVQAFIDLLPQDTFARRVLPEWSWFMDPARRTDWDRVEAPILGYADGLMRDIYHRYIHTAGAEFTAQLLDI